MGCGQTKQADQAYRSNAERDAAANTKKPTDDDEDVAAAEEDPLARSGSVRSLTRVCSTRGRVASSSSSMPYLPESQLHKSVPAPAKSPDDTGSGSPSPNSSLVIRPFASTPPGAVDFRDVKRTFSMGDLTMDPEDVVRQRRERLNRRYSVQSSGGSSSSGSFVGSPAPAGGTGNSTGRTNVGAFRLHDVVMHDDELEDPFGIARDSHVRHNDHWIRGAHVRPLHGLPRRVKGLVAVPGGDLYLCSVAESEVVVLRGRRGDNEVRRHPDWRTSLRRSAAMDRVAAIAADPSGDRFATCSADGTVVVRDVDSDSSSEGAPKTLFADDEFSGGFACALAFAGEKLLVVGDTHGRIRVWDLDKSTSVTAQLHGVAGPRSKASVHVVAANAAGDACLTAGQDGLAHVMDPLASTVAPLVTYAGHDGRSIKFGGLLRKDRAVTVCDRAAHIWGSADAVPCFVYDLTSLLTRGVGRSTVSPVSNHPAPSQQPQQAASHPANRPQGLTSLTIPAAPSAEQSPSGKATIHSGAHGGVAAGRGTGAGPCSMWVARVALFGPSGIPRARIVTTGCIVDADDERVIICIADTFGNLIVTPLPLTTSACRCDDCLGTSLHFRAPVAVLAAMHGGMLVAGDGFGNLYEIEIRI